PRRSISRAASSAARRRPGSAIRLRAGKALGIGGCSFISMIARYAARAGSHKILRWRKVDSKTWSLLYDVFETILVASFALAFLLERPTGYRETEGPHLVCSSIDASTNCSGGGGWRQAQARGDGATRHRPGASGAAT